MFNLNLNKDDIIMRITVMKPVGKKDVVANFVGNLLTRAGGDVAYKVHLILTNNFIYLEYIGHAAIGYAEETRDIDKIKLEDLKEFLVEAKDDEELIKITTTKKEYCFNRNNSKKDNLALAMSKVIEDIKWF